MNSARANTGSSDTPTSHQARWWNSKTVLLALALHVFLFLGLFQLSYPPDEWKRIETAYLEQSIGDAANLIMREHGLFGFVIWYYNTHGEAELYYRYAKLTLFGNADHWTQNKTLKTKNDRPWPYRDIAIEYQPGALLTISLPALFADDFREYQYWLGGWFGFLHLLNLFMGIKLVTGGAPTVSQVNRLLWWSLAFLVLLGGMVTSRFDHIVVTFVLLSTLLFGQALQKEGTRSLLGFALFGFVTSIGVLTKIVPGLVMITAMLMLLIMQKKTPRWAEAFSSVTGLGVGLIVLNAGFYAFFGAGYLESFTYHMDRGIQLESVYAGVLLLARMAGLAIVTYDYSFGSSNVVSSFTNEVKLISPFLFLGIVGFLGAKIRRNCLPENKTAGHFIHSQFILMTLILLLAFMLTNKVFSPQYMIWVGPLMAVLVAVHQNLWKTGILLLIATTMTQILYPQLYIFLEHFHPALVILLNLRNALLIVILVLLIRKLPGLIEKDHSS
jgi:hypothetical protein